MRITPNTLRVTEWEVDKNIFNGKPLLIPVHPEFGAAEMIGSKDNANEGIPIIMLGIKWYYELFYNSKSILKYIVEDDYWSSMTERNNDKGDLDTMIMDSYDRAKKEFSKRIKPLGTDFELHPLAQGHIDHVRSKLIERLKQKGF